MGEIRLLFEGGKVEYGQPPVLVGAREGAATTPKGRPAVPELNCLARMIDPDRGLRPFTEAQMEDRFLIAPFVPAIVGGGAHCEIAALVVIERGEPVLALGKPPFLMLIGLMAGNGAQAFRHDQTMVAQADRQLRQGVNATAIPTRAPEQASDTRKLKRAAGAERMLVGAALSCRHHATVSRAGDQLRTGE